MKYWLPGLWGQRAVCASNPLVITLYSKTCVKTDHEVLKRDWIWFLSEYPVLFAHTAGVCWMLLEGIVRKEPKLYYFQEALGQDDEAERATL